MKLFKFNILLLFIFILGCGFQSTLKIKDKDFSISKIEILGDKELTNIINNNLNNFKNNNNPNKKYYLNINILQEKIITSKNTKGEPKTFRIEIETILNVKENNEDMKRKIFYEKINYNNISSKFELKQYENNLKKNLVEKISRDIIIYLSSIS